MIDMKRDNCVTCRTERGSEGWYSLRVLIGKREERLYSDLTRDLDLLEDLADRINRGRVSPIHIEDILEDFLD